MSALQWAGLAELPPEPTPTLCQSTKEPSPGQSPERVLSCPGGRTHRHSLGLLFGGQRNPPGTSPELKVLGQFLGVRENDAD